MAKDLEPWGFMVAVSAFMIQLLTFGVSLSFGLYVIELQKEFHSGLSLISAIGAINLGVQLGAVWSAFFAAIVLILPDYFVTVGLNRSDTAWLMSLQHIFSFLGCIVSGFVSSHPKINKVALLVFSNFVSGIVTFAYTYHVLQTFSGFVALSVFGGLSSGIYLGLLVVILADVVGNELIGDGMGLMMFASGIGTVAGPPLGGNLVDETGSFESAFYYNGTAVLLAGIVLAPVTLRGLIRRGKSRKYSVSSFTKQGPSTR